MNLSDEQRDALSTLPIGTAVVRLAMNIPSRFWSTSPCARSGKEPSRTAEIRQRMAGCSGEFRLNSPPPPEVMAVSPVSGTG